MRTRRSLAALVLVAFVSSSVPATYTREAAAQGADDAVTVQARARFKEGVEFFDKGKYEEARLAFLQAYTLKKHPAVLLNLAQSSAKSNHSLEAAKYFKQFLKESTTATPQQKRDAEAGLAEVRQKLGRIEVLGAGTGTDISVDDEKVGTTPLPEAIDVEPGPHTVKTPTESVKVVATVGQKTEAKFGASQAATPAVVPTPVTTPAPANPPPDNTTQPPPNNPPPGETPAKKPGLLSPPESMGPVYLGLVVGGVGLAGAIVFAAFKADAQSKADAVASDIRKAAQQRGISSQGVCSSTNAQTQKDFGAACKTLKDNNDKVDTNATIANVSLVVMGVGFLTAAGWYLFAPKREDHAPPPSAKYKPVITPYASWNESGLVMSGAF